MTSTRNILLIALLFIGYLFWTQWQEDYDHPPAQTAATATPSANTPAVTPAGADIPAAANSPATSSPPASASMESAPPSVDRIVVNTDVLRVEIDPRGGNVVAADLLAYPQQPKDFAHPVRLLDASDATFFVAQSGLISVQGSAVVAPDHQAMYRAEKNAYSLAAAESVEVPLSWTDPNGLSVRKVFLFKRGSYVIEQREEIENKSVNAWSGNAYRQLQRVPPIVDSKGLKGYSNTERYSFAGAAVYSPTDKFQKLKFENFQKEPLKKSFDGGWAAMLQHYFFAAWIPFAGEVDSYTTAVLETPHGPRYLVRTLSPTLSVAAGETKTDTAR
ncbi:MAG: membrane protein insertase YidC, partial [Dokdonella sp.]